MTNIERNEQNPNVVESAENGAVRTVNEPSSAAPQLHRDFIRASSSLRLPEVEPWPEAVDGKALLSRLSDAIRRFVFLPQGALETLALWVLHTYAFELREVTTYLGIESPEKRCGKTTLLAVLSELVNRPVVAANISPSAFFRLIEECRPTLMIDEADTYLHGNDELRGILNAGYSPKTAFVVRVAYERDDTDLEDAETSGGGSESGSKIRSGSKSETAATRTLGTRLMRYSCWCPKVLAAIGRLPETLADRCIVIRMQRKRADEECERIRNLDASDLRRQCARFVLDHGASIARWQPEIPSELNDRAADIWEPLLALAELAGGDWPERARQAAKTLSASAQENNPIGSLLMDIFFIFAKADADKMFSRTLIESLNCFAGRPWAEMVRVRTAAAPQGVTDMWLAQKLRPYGIRSTTLRIGPDLGKGYLREHFTEVFRRYIPESEVEELRRELAVRREAMEDNAQKTQRETTNGDK